ncbi:hypothetical protein M011DRAFT_479090 [Sporormia fimetaria CBS 119925]|uniref:Rhodopsin domain-containing protein n=1 Tax=Sporormia fimetaria CBS 119925 TaxID=1340428 RepID=A0A6A6V3T0_9PLEO|nr:hypothetical protein M011DRAFT_479090 [Sporormia fimetaria CBS 119925]
MEIPLRYPPFDATSNFTNPDFLGRPVLIIGGICLPLILLFLGTRLYARAVVLKHWRVHDYIHSLTSAVAVSLIALTIWMVLSDGGHHAWDLDRLRMQKSTITSLVGFWTALGPMLWFMKLTLLSFLFSCFDHVRWYKHCMWVGVTFTGLTFAAYTVVVTMTCGPKQGSDLQSHQNGLNRAVCTASDGTNAIVSNAAIIINSITNFLLLSISYPLAFKLSLRKVEMRGVYSMLVSGGVLCVCSSMSAYYRVKSWQSVDVTGSQIPFYASFILEMTLSLIIPCMPSVWITYRHLTVPEIDDKTTIATPNMKSISTFSTPGAPSRATVRNTRDIEDLPFRKSSADYAGPRDSRMKALPVTPLPVAVTTPPTPRTPSTFKSMRFPILRSLSTKSSRSNWSRSNWI